MAKLEVLSKGITEIKELEIGDLSLCRKFNQSEVHTICRFVNRCEQHDGILRYVAITRDSLAVLIGPSVDVEKGKTHHSVMGKLKNTKSTRFLGLLHPSVYFSFVQGIGVFPIENLQDLLITPIEDTSTL